MTSAPSPASDRVFLVVADDSAELEVALRYACRRARKTRGRVALLAVVEPGDDQHWMAVGDLMKEESRQAAEQMLQRLAERVNEWTGTMPILYVREGVRGDELLKLIEEEPSISILVLGANPGPKGPGPLVSMLTGKMVGRLRVPVTIVPGNLSLEDVDKVS
ncbi:MAG TPA: universal stress protein [Alphaproteobacteria bacterium]|nr:universal stress protein [Alphaproteobacteria bacterium]